MPLDFFHQSVRKCIQLFGGRLPSEADVDEAPDFGSPVRAYELAHVFLPYSNGFVLPRILL